MVNENDLTTKDSAHYNLITKQHYQELIRIKGWKSKEYSFWTKSVTWPIHQDEIYGTKYWIQQKRFRENKPRHVHVKLKPQNRTKTCFMKWLYVAVEYFIRIKKKLFENNENKSPTHVDIRYPYSSTSASCKWILAFEVAKKKYGLNNKMI